MNSRGAFKHMIEHPLTSVRSRSLPKLTLSFRLVVAHSMRLTISCWCSIVTYACFGNRKYFLLKVGLNSRCHVLWVPILFSFFVGIFFLGTFILPFLLLLPLFLCPFLSPPHFSCPLDLTQQRLIFQIHFLDLSVIVGHALLIFEASRSHSDTQRSVGLLWTNDQPEAEILPDNTSMPRRDSNPNPNKSAAANPGLRRHGRWDRR